MKTAILKRTSTSAAGTFGVLSIWKLTFLTGELPWRNNESGLSCIPPGSYRCEWTPSPKLKRDTYELQGVFRRTAIRIHPANFMGDRAQGLHCELDGCISLGRIIRQVNGQLALLKSRDAVEALETHLGGEEFLLEIVDAIPKNIL